MLSRSRLARATLLTAFALPARALAAPPDKGGKPRQHVLHVASRSHDATDALRLTKELERLAIAEPEVRFVNSNASLLLALDDAKCGRAFTDRVTDPRGFDEASGQLVDAACLAKVAARVGSAGRPAERIVWGYVYRGRDGATYAGVHLWQADQPATKATLPLRPETLERVARRLYLRTTQAGRVGDVRVTTGEPLAGELFVNGASQGAFDSKEAEFTLPLGEVTAEVRAGTRVLARGRGAVSADGMTAVALAREPEPAPTPPAPATAVAPSSAPLPERAAANWQTPAGWAGIGVGAALIGLGVVATLRHASLRDDFTSEPALARYRAGVQRGGELCDSAERGVVAPGGAAPDEVRGQCSSVSTWRTLQVGSFVAGGVLAVGGAVLLLTAPQGQQPAATTEGRVRWRFAPSIGPTVVGSTLQVAW